MFPVSGVQIHLALNHLPVFALLFATVALAFALATRRRDARTLGLGLVCLGAVAILPTTWSGESAEEIVEHRRGVSESLIERHEESAETTQIVTLVAAALALLALGAQRLRRTHVAGAFAVLTLATSLVATAGVGYG